MTLEFYEIEKAVGRFIDILDVLKKVEPFRSHGEAEIFINIDNRNRLAIEGQLNRVTFDTEDSTFWDVINHMVHFGPMFSDTEEEFGCSKV
jgi:hypothetical protein